MVRYLIYFLITVFSNCGISLLGQQSLRLNQMMAPSMPNIAHSSGYASNISASQSMQNVNMINPNHSNGAYNQHTIGSYGHPNQTLNSTNGNQMTAASSHSHMYHPQDMQKAQHQHIQQQQQQLQSNQSTLLRGQNKMSEMTEMLKRRHQRQQEMMPMHSLDGSSPTTAPSPLSPVKTLPPTAPKPQVE